MVIEMGYTTDLSDKQWEFIEPRFKEENGNYGKNAKWSKRELVNGVLYLTKTGCQWSLLPNDFPPYKTVFSFYSRAVKAGLWEIILGDLVALSRKSEGREEVPSYALIDSQSAKTTGAAEERGIDGGKKQKAERGIS